MKPLIYLVIASLCITGCKKSSTSLAPVQIVASQLTDKTSISIKVIDVTQSNSTILSLTNKFGNNTYETAPVSAGDQLTITISSNVDDNLAGDGVGIIKYLYKGESVGWHGGIIGTAGFTQRETIPQP